MNNYNQYPAEMRRLKQWVLWKLVKKTDGKIIKMPFQVNGFPAKSNDPDTWYTYADALQALQGGQYSGLGFMFTEESHILFIDLDHCISSNGELNAIATETLRRLPLSFVELSQSKTGLHLFTLGTVPKNIKTKLIEIYSHMRFCALTGMVYRQVSQLSDEQTGVDYLYAQFKKPDPVKKDFSPDTAVAPAGDVVRLLMKDQKAAQLFKGVWAGSYESQSNADLALCEKIAFFAGRDPQAIDDIFRQSKLYRPKWDQMRGDMTYGQRTVKTACELLEETYTEYRIRKGRDQFEAFCRAIEDFE